MSHFTLLVVETDDGPGYEELLAPYYEGLTVEGYWEEVWGQDKELPIVEKARNFLRENPQFLDLEMEDLPEDSDLVDPYDDVAPKRSIDDLDDMTIMSIYCDGVEVRINPETGRWERMTEYNPDSRWDWYVVGGRWSGLLKIKEGADPEDYDHNASEDPALGLKNTDPNFCDRIRLRALDVEGMRSEAEKEAHLTWDRLEDIVEKFGPLPNDDFRNLPRGTQEEIEAWEAAKKEYWEHPSIVALREANLTGWMSMPSEIFAGNREDFVNRARDAAIPCYAYLSEEDGWVEPGRMGWFGMSTDNEKSRQEYHDRVNKQIDSLPGDTWLTVIDCHI